jgi:hypothetical protein
MIHLLRSPSRQLQRFGQEFMRQHYHMRTAGAVQVRLVCCLNASLAFELLTGCELLTTTISMVGTFTCQHYHMRTAGAVQVRLVPKQARLLLKMCG